MDLNWKRMLHCIHFNRPLKMTDEPYLTFHLAISTDSTPRLASIVFSRTLLFILLNLLNLLFSPHQFDFSFLLFLIWTKLTFYWKFISTIASFLLNWWTSLSSLSLHLSSPLLFTISLLNFEPLMYTFWWFQREGDKSF